MSSVLTMLRQTGRSTRMFKQAINTAILKPTTIVDVVVDNKEHLPPSILNMSHLPDNLKIYSYNDFKNNLTPDLQLNKVYSEKNHILFVDHAVYEKKYNEILTQLHKWDSNININITLI